MTNNTQASQQVPSGMTDEQIMTMWSDCFVQACRENKEMLIPVDACIKLFARAVLAAATPGQVEAEAQGYQYRRIGPVEGPSIWVPCDKNTFDYYSRYENDGYEVRELYALKPSSEQRGESNE